MRNRLSLLLLALTMVATVFALPAKRGQYKTITLSDGSSVVAQLMGDEHKSWWQAEDGRQFVKSDDNTTFVETKASQLSFQMPMPEQNTNNGMRKAAGHKPSEPVVGDRKGLIVLVQFSDLSFEEGHDMAYFNNVANGVDFTSEDGYVGSVRDYFRDQSDKKLDYTFDIVGPVTLSKTHDYYGQDSGSTHDVNMSKFIKESFEAVMNDIDFTNYDNDNDGEVDNIFFIYAGKHQADGGGDNCIWPHMFYFPSLGLNYTRNGKKLNVYACSSELQANNRPGGIGAICHEFSHCLGLPDLYNTDDGDNYGANDWSLMHSGAYLGSCFRPCGYSSYERDFMGWRSMIELKNDTTVVDATPISQDGGVGYKMVNDNNTREYYILEPRHRDGWDAALPGSGLLVWHIDYSYNAWVGNTVNNTASHQRCAVVCADNSTSSTSVGNDPFPYGTNDMFTDETTPATSLFNVNSDGTKFLHKSVYGIKENASGIVSFNFMNGVYHFSNNDRPEGALFYEGFKRCGGVGGNDESGSFKTGFAGTFNPDNDGWTYNSAYAGYECARFGTSSKDGYAVTPEFTIDDIATLTFKAAPFNMDPAQVELSVESGDATLDKTVFPTNKGTWTECETTIKGTGAIKVRFQGYSRMILDEILVMPGGTDGISLTPALSQGEGAMYNLAGQKVNADYKGVVIKNGKKYYRF